MASERVQIQPLSAAAEENLIDYRLSHPDALAKQASRHFYLLDTSYLPTELQAAAAQENAKRSENLELDVSRYTLALKRARKATAAQKLQQETYAAQTSSLASRCQERRQEIVAERDQLQFASKKKKMHEECSALVKQLNGRPRKRVELDQLIGDIEKQIKEQEALIAAYQSESAGRLEAFNEAFTALEKVSEVDKVEPDRSQADLVALDKIISTSKDSALVAAASSSSRAGSPSVAASGKTLDPVFTPVGRPNMPNSTASSSVLPSTASRSTAHSRKDKSSAANLGKNASASRASTPGVPASKANAGTRDRSGKDAAGRKAGNASAAGRARSPLAGNVTAASKEPGAARVGGRRQATNVPSQLGKSSTINMEDGEISSNTSEGALDSAQQKPNAGKGGSNGKGKSGGGESGNGNKRHRQEPEDAAVKRRKVGEGKQDGVTGV